MKSKTSKLLSDYIPRELSAAPFNLRKINSAPPKLHILAFFFPRSLARRWSALEQPDAPGAMQTTEERGSDCPGGKAGERDATQKASTSGEVTSDMLQALS